MNKEANVWFCVRLTVVSHVVMVIGQQALFISTMCMSQSTERSTVVVPLSLQLPMLIQN